MVKLSGHAVECTWHVGIDPVAKEPVNSLLAWAQRDCQVPLLHWMKGTGGGDEHYFGVDSVSGTGPAVAMVCRVGTNRWRWRVCGGQGEAADLLKAQCNAGRWYAWEKKEGRAKPLEIPVVESDEPKLYWHFYDKIDEYEYATASRVRSGSVVAYLGPADKDGYKWASALSNGRGQGIYAYKHEAKAAAEKAWRAEPCVCL